MLDDLQENSKKPGRAHVEYQYKRVKLWKRDASDIFMRLQISGKFKNRWEFDEFFIFENLKFSSYDAGGNVRSVCVEGALYESSVTMKKLFLIKYHRRIVLVVQ